MSTVKSNKDLIQAISELENYAKIANDEYSEYIINLCNLARNIVFLDGGLKNEIDDEVINQLQYYKENFKIEETEVEITVTQKRKKLIAINE